MPVYDAVFRKSRSFLFAALLAIGAIGGLTVPLAKFALSTGQGAFGLAISAMLMGLFMVAPKRVGAILAARFDALAPSRSNRENSGETAVWNQDV